MQTDFHTEKVHKNDLLKLTETKSCYPLEKELNPIKICFEPATNGRGALIKGHSTFSTSKVIKLQTYTHYIPAVQPLQNHGYVHIPRYVHII